MTLPGNAAPEPKRTITARVERAGDTVSAYLVGGWPPVADFAIELLTSDPPSPRIAFDGERVTLTFANGAASYRKLSVDTARGIWTGARL